MLKLVGRNEFDKYVTDQKNPTIIANRFTNLVIERTTGNIVGIYSLQYVDGVGSEKFQERYYISK